MDLEVIPMTCRRHQFSTQSDPGDISSTFYFNASSTVRKQNCHSNRIADSTTLVTVDGTDDRAHVFQSLIIGGPGTYVPFPSHSFLAPIGATAWILMLDCRAERKLGQVCSEEQYTKVFDRLNSLPSRVEHLIIQLGIPIAYPRMVFLEHALSSRFSPVVALGRLGIEGFVNRFNGDAELLDDLNDHWTSSHHKSERNRFVERLQNFALSRKIRISFLCGDVHCAAVGLFKTTKSRWSSGIPTSSDHRYMLSVVTSAIVNTPPPHHVVSMVDMRSTKRHKSMHYADTDEEMVPLFDRDTDGSKPKSHYIMGRRNWCSITLTQPSGDLLFDIRVEKETGYGETVGYSVTAPPPRWTPRTVK
ncbi:hypothetical protein BGY98DRAFT_993844 [Russula aff. rugulosa BPL654]|nr:hypothetical protein BGY98DRAFT_993844 [Russula aff. rugulosa BPL654]